MNAIIRNFRKGWRYIRPLSIAVMAVSTFFWVLLFVPIASFPDALSGSINDAISSGSRGILLWGNLVRVQLDDNEISFRWALMGCYDNYTIANNATTCGYLSRSVDVYFDQEFVFHYSVVSTANRSYTNSSAAQAPSKSVQFTTTHSLDAIGWQPAIFQGGNGLDPGRTAIFEIQLRWNETEEAPLIASIVIPESVVEGWELSGYWNGSVETSPGPEASEVINIQVELAVITPSSNYTITLVAVGFALSLGSALATLYTVWAVISGRAKGQTSGRLVGPLTVVATIIAIRTAFPLTPVLGTTLDYWLYYPSLLLALASTVVSAIFVYASPVWTALVDIGEPRQPDPKLAARPQATVNTEVRARANGATENHEMAEVAKLDKSFRGTRRHSL